jgi:hypothetical protein
MQIPTIASELLNDLLNNYIFNDAAILLINYPELGFDNTPTQEELNLRKSLTMVDAALREVSSIENNYNRYYITPLDLSIGSNPFSRIIKASFDAQGAAIGPFTHAVLAKGVNKINGDVTNGNNRGDEQGTVILSTPVPIRILSGGALGNILEDTQSLDIEIPINLIARAFGYAAG